jgi:methylated-DNA-[protein]-cysteine S-methyltransferase
MSEHQEQTARQVVHALLESETAFGDDTQARLHDGLVARAADEDLLDVSYRTVESPVGPLLLAATPAGLVRVAFDREDHDAVLERLATDVSPRILRAPSRLDDVATQLDEYFAGRRRAFEFPIDLQLAHGFRRTVLEHLCDIAYGTTESYTIVAAASGSPAAVRAVGSACAQNPIPLVVPCHRVVRSDGTLGGYRGGIDAKRALLAMEAA